MGNGSLVGTGFLWRAMEIFLKTFGQDRGIGVVSRTRAENQMETCGVHLDGTLFLPAQGRTPRVPVKAAKGSCAERSQASSFIHARSKQASYRSGSCSYLCIALGSGGTFACLLLISLFQLTLFLFLIHSRGFSSLSILDLQEVFCLAMLIIV